MRIHEAGRRGIVLGALSSALVLNAAGAASADSWVYGTGTATYHDKKTAHDAAYRKAVANADRACGTMATTDQVEMKTTYTPAPNDPSQWRAAVTVREMCIELVHPAP